MLNIDYHRINEQHGAINLLETNSSTLSEMVLALGESVQGGLLDAQVATALLAGIMAATDRFTSANTTAKSMTVAAQMLAAGADQQKVTKEIFGERERKPRRDEQPKSAPKPEYKSVEKVEAPKPEPAIEAPQAPDTPQEPEVFEMAPDVEQEIDDFINGGADNDPLTWEAPAEDGVINYRP